MNLSKLEFMREQLGDISDAACIEIYDAIRKTHWMDAGQVLWHECEDAVFAHYEESMVREPDEVDRRLDEEAA